MMPDLHPDAIMHIKISGWNDTETTYIVKGGQPRGKSLCESNYFKIPQKNGKELITKNAGEK